VAQLHRPQQPHNILQTRFIVKSIPAAIGTRTTAPVPAAAPVGASGSGSCSGSASASAPPAASSLIPSLQSEQLVLDIGIGQTAGKAGTRAAKVIAEISNRIVRAASDQLRDGKLSISLRNQLRAFAARQRQAEDESGGDTQQLYATEVLRVANGGALGRDQKGEVNAAVNKGELAG